ncbi:MAG: exosortase E/protease, VPEID-CTERM system [Planctomycetia bacterium]|nr:exosortase E/protease, VPEID-CTERM system [Planctomycetia bacterium]
MRSEIKNPSDTVTYLNLTLWRGIVAGIIFIEFILFISWVDFARLIQTIKSWPGLYGLQILVGTCCTASLLAFLFGSRYTDDQMRPVVDWILILRRPVPFLLLHTALLIGIIILTAVVAEGSEVYKKNFLRYASGWLLLVGSMFVVNTIPFLGKEVWFGVLRGGWDVFVTACIVGFFVCAIMLAYPTWWILNGSTLFGVKVVLRLLVTDLLYQPENAIIGTPNYSVEIVCACGGIEGIGLSLVFLSTYLWLYRHNLLFPRSFLLLPIAISLMWLLNVARIVGLVLIGSNKDSWISPDGFHAQAGWFGFLIIHLGIVVITRYSTFFSVNTEHSMIPLFNMAEVAFLSPALALISLAMLSPLFGDGLDWLYPLRVITVALLLYILRRHYRQVLRYTWSWESVGVGIAVFILWLALEPLVNLSESGESLRNQISQLSTTWLIFWLFFRVVGSSITVPLAEELAFRGFLTRRLIAGDFQSVPSGTYSTLSFLLSSLLFGLVHGRWFAGTLAGMAYALTLYRRRELMDAVLAHAVTNFLLACYILLTGRWSLWS